MYRQVGLLFKSIIKSDCLTALNSICQRLFFEIFTKKSFMLAWMNSPNYLYIYIGFYQNIENVKIEDPKINFNTCILYEASVKMF